VHPRGLQREGAPDLVDPALRAGVSRASVLSRQSCFMQAVPLAVDTPQLVELSCFEVEELVERNKMTPWPMALSALRGEGNIHRFAPKFGPTLRLWANLKILGQRCESQFPHGVTCAFW
jgi:hypothetical protein